MFIHTFSPRSLTRIKCSVVNDQERWHFQGSVGSRKCLCLPKARSLLPQSFSGRTIRGGDRCLGCLLIGQETIDVVFYKVLLKRTLDHRLQKVSEWYFVCLALHLVTDKGRQTDSSHAGTVFSGEANMCWLAMSLLSFGITTTSPLFMSSWTKHNTLTLLDYFM